MCNHWRWSVRRLGLAAGHTEAEGAEEECDKASQGSSQLCRSKKHSRKAFKQTRNPFMVGDDHKLFWKATYHHIGLAS